ncbi:MAG: sterol desaturase family protein [Pyrinomonadaceae bacterium]
MFSGVAVFVLEWGISNDIGVMRHLNLGTPATLLIAILFLDFFGAYVSHVILHKVSVLWRVHSVHHSDTMIDVTSALRQHPFETLYRMSFVVLGALFLGIPFWMLGLYMLLLVGNGQLEHANISYPEKLERLLRQVFVTPDFHKVHHSTNADESNSNFGNIFTIWDRLFGTYESNCELKDLRYGLNDSCDDEDGGSVKDLLLLSTGE